MTHGWMPKRQRNKPRWSGKFSSSPSTRCHSFRWAAICRGSPGAGGSANPKRPSADLLECQKVMIYEDTQTSAYCHRERGEAISGRPRDDLNSLAMTVAALV